MTRPLILWELLLSFVPLIDFSSEAAYSQARYRSFWPVFPAAAERGKNSLPDGVNKTVPFVLNPTASERWASGTIEERSACEESPSFSSLS
jgi:hypothetical protein